METKGLRKNIGETMVVRCQVSKKQVANTRMCLSICSTLSFVWNVTECRFTKGVEALQENQHMMLHRISTVVVL